MPYAYQGDNCYGRGDYYRGDYYRGDPGLLGSLFKGVTGAIGGFIRGGPVGAILGGVRGVTGLNPKQGTTLAPAGQQLQIPQIAGPTGVQVAQGGILTGPIQVQRFGMGGGGGGGGGQAMVVTPSGQLCTVKGTHVNKRGYWTKSRGYIEAGSVCVKNRRMNVANPRALRRAIRRSQGFIKLARRSVRLFGLSVQRPQRKLKGRR